MKPPPADSEQDLRANLIRISHLAGEGLDALGGLQTAREGKQAAFAQAREQDLRAILRDIAATCRHGIWNAATIAGELNALKSPSNKNANTHAPEQA